MTQTPVKNPFLRSLNDLKLDGKQVFLRCDFNVPVEDGRILDSNRIDEALPSIRACLAQGAKLILASHLGRPKGRKNNKFTLEPVATALADKLKVDVTLADDCIGEGIELMVKNLGKGQILLLENLRFHEEEEANAPEFCKRLARLCDVYINDAFGTAHRKHASVYGLPELMTERGVGLLMAKEIQYLSPLIRQPEQPFWAVLGGAKVSDKIGSVEALLSHVQGLCIGGAMAFAFYKALGKKLPEGAKEPGTADVAAANKILAKAAAREVPVHLPVDLVESFDIGPQTVALFSEALAAAKTVFWNGPMGWFEKAPYDAGTVQLAKNIAELSAIKIVGGGDTVSAVKLSGVANKFDHLSTGGGAVLEYLEFAQLPGIEILKELPNRVAR